MIGKMLLVGTTVVLFAGCNAGDKIQKTIDDIKKDYFEEKVAGVTEERTDSLPAQEINAPLTEQKNALIQVHNDARMAVGVNSKLTWSDSLEVVAKAYANHLAQSGTFEHDPNNHSGGYGENLYAWTNKPTLAYAAKAWVDERDFYRYGKIGDKSTCTQEPCGHYTQIIWENTSKVGCAMSRYTAGTFKGGYVVVCKYQTPGNYLGEKPYKK